MTRCTSRRWRVASEVTRGASPEYVTVGADLNRLKAHLRRLKKLIENEIPEEGLDDWVPIDRLIGLARDDSAARQADFKAITRQVPESLLSREEIVVGVIGDDGFEAWAGTVSEVVERVVSELDAVDWQPYRGGCWLGNASRGDGRARRHE